jgi:hypothetical protein
MHPKRPETIVIDRKLPAKLIHHPHKSLIVCNSHNFLPVNPAYWAALNWTQAYQTAKEVQRFSSHCKALQTRHLGKAAQNSRKKFARI